MSFTYVIFDCDKCDFQGNSTITWGDFKYVNEGKETNVNRDLGWCFECNKLVPIEDFSDSDRVIDLIELTTKELEGKANNKFSISFSKRDGKVYLINEILEYSQRLKFIRERIGSEKCLMCGSMEIKPFDGDYSFEPKEYMKRPFNSTKNTGFIHPGCGGGIIAKYNPVRINLESLSRYYSIDGKPLNSEAD